MWCILSWLMIFFPDIYCFIHLSLKSKMPFTIPRHNWSIGASTNIWNDITVSNDLGIQNSISSLVQNAIWLRTSYTDLLIALFNQCNIDMHCIALWPNDHIESPIQLFSHNLETNQMIIWLAQNVVHSWFDVMVEKWWKFEYWLKLVVLTPMDLVKRQTWKIPKTFHTLLSSFSPKIGKPMSCLDLSYGWHPTQFVC